MKTKIISIALLAIIMVGETSCLVRVHARGPRAKVRVRADIVPVENPQQRSVALPLENLPGYQAIEMASK